VKTDETDVLVGSEITGKEVTLIIFQKKVAFTGFDFTTFEGS
jgi:hypothetical protein